MQYWSKFRVRALFDDAPLQKRRSLRLLWDHGDDDEVSVEDIESRKCIAEHYIHDIQIK